MPTSDFTITQVAFALTVLARTTHVENFTRSQWEAFGYDYYKLVELGFPDKTEVHVVAIQIISAAIAFGVKKDANEQNN